MSTPRIGPEVWRLSTTGSGNRFTPHSRNRSLSANRRISKDDGGNEIRAEPSRTGKGHNTRTGLLTLR
uniref:Uncharacterized protein n=1 Tax=Anopheles albimanus TaxID=7167 RepID=A0A182FXQ4_ANOAL